MSVFLIDKGRGVTTITVCGARHTSLLGGGATFGGNAFLKLF